MTKKNNNENQTSKQRKQLTLASVINWLMGRGAKVTTGEELVTPPKRAGKKTAVVPSKTEKTEPTGAKTPRVATETPRAQAQRELEEEQARLQQLQTMELPLDWENIFDEDVRTQGVHVDSAADALVMSQRTLGRVDIEYMASITGMTYKQVIEGLGDAIYQNPETWEECFYKGWETADEYLTGNLARKWSIARKANKKFKGYFGRNLKAIKKILPPTVATKDIYITLGSPWVPTDIIDDFIFHLFGRSPYVIKSKILHDEVTGTWDIPYKAYYYDARVYSTYGTKRISALHIIERTLNMKNIVVTDEVACSSTKSGKKRVVNQEETLLAIEKQKLLIQEFQRWVWEDEKRKLRLEEIFDKTFGCVRLRHYDGSFLDFPNMNKEVQLYPYQKNAVARILFSKNTLLAHEVGAGKTYVMIAAAMELRRMGLSNKNLFVVPNNLVGQWKDIFLHLYPGSRVFTVTSSNFSIERRKKTLETLRDEDFDGVIMAASCFDMLRVSSAYEEEVLKEEKALLDELAESKDKCTSGVEKRRKKIKERLLKLREEWDKTKEDIFFDQLGVTRLFVDEAHNYKNVPIETKITRVLGINADGSSKGKSMLEKVKCVQRQNNGGGVIMATGTPITNSITDAFVMQTYLQSGELATLDLQCFDAWIGMFAEKSTEFEVDVDTNSYRLATRFSKFHNLPELTALLSSIADFHQIQPGEQELPDFDGYQDCLVGKTAEFNAYLQKISARADKVRKGGVKRTEDNMLMITTDGRKAALDVRLVDKKAGFSYQSKVARCAENVCDIYFKTCLQKSTQLVFCDSSTPKDGFNMYDELKRLLVEMHVPEAEIAFVHEATSEKRRTELFDKMRKGELRVLIGSTFKLGLGVNVQDKLIAIHHLDVPWRPADMVQREGRILRQGNVNEKVFIYRYITEGSFDAYSWQLLETKQNFITAMLEGSWEERSGADVDETVLNYAEVKALAIGNPLIKKRVETANELNRYVSLQRKLVETRENLQYEKQEMPERIAEAQKRLDDAMADMEYYARMKVNIEAEDRRDLRDVIFTAVQNNYMKETEFVLMQYQGFDLVLPANMLLEKPYILLRHTGSYYVELGDSEKGVMTRLDNFLEGFPALIKKFKTRVQELRLQVRYIEEELAKSDNYVEDIQRKRKELAEIDEQLGVKKSA